MIFSAGVIGVSFRGAVVSSGDVHDDTIHAISEITIKLVDDIDVVFIYLVS